MRDIHIVTKYLRYVRPLPACLLLCGCVGNVIDLSEVSAELKQRTDYELHQTKPGKTVWPNNISPDDGLSENELVMLALWNNAGFKETLTEIGFAEANLIQAGMLPNPTLAMLFPVSGKPLELTLRYPLEFLWLRPERVESAKLDYHATVLRLVQSGLDLIRDVRVACADLALARERYELAQASARLSQETEELTQARLRAGDATELEAISAHADVQQALERVTRLQYEAGIVQERLRVLAGLGLEKPLRYTIGKQPPRSGIPGDAENLVTEALKIRPDYQAIEQRLEAAGKRIGLARVEAFALSAGLNAKEIATSLKTGPSLDITLPVFNQNQGGIAQALSQFEKAAYQYITIRDRIILDIRESYKRLFQATISLDQWQKRVIPPIEDSVLHARNAYASGNVSYLFVLENQRKLFDARLNAATVSADVRRAHAELERSVGRRLDQSTDKITDKHS